MQSQHGSFNVKLDMLIDRHATTDKKADKAHERIDAQNTTLIHIKEDAEKALGFGEDYNDNKKKLEFGAWALSKMALGVSAVAGGVAWIVTKTT
jgi:hypothetical protein